MQVGARLRCGPPVAFVALLLVSAVILCLVHADTGDADDVCTGFGPTVGPVALLPLVSLGHSNPALVNAYQAVIVDLSAPPPEA